MKLKKELFKEIDSHSDNEIKRMAFVYKRLTEHLLLAGEKETRTREKARIKIALKLIDKWSNEYDN
jgi:hypothetical protein